MSEVRVDVSGKDWLSFPFWERIRDRAKELFLRSNAEPNRDLDNWLEAEREFLWTPPAEMTESAEAFEIRVAAPGFKPEELHVFAEATHLVIEGEHKENRETKDGDRVVFSEFSNRTLFRKFPFETPVDVDHVTAKLTSGELRIEAPKRKEVAAKVSRPVTEAVTPPNPPPPPAAATTAAARAAAA